MTSQLVVQGLRVIRGGRRDRWQIIGATVGGHHGKARHGQLHQRSKAPGETHGAILGMVPGAKYAIQIPLGPGLGATVGACHGVFRNQRMEESLFLIDIVI